jgi:hypothetical protein
VGRYRAGGEVLFLSWSQCETYTMVVRCQKE